MKVTIQFIILFYKYTLCMNRYVQGVQLQWNAIIFSLSNKKAFTHFVKKIRKSWFFRFRLLIENISLLVCWLRTAIDMQVFPFIVSFPVTQHEVQTAALRKHKPRVKIYQCKADNYQTTEVTRHNHALNFACKLKWAVNQVAVKPAATFNAVPGYCLPCYRGSKLNV